MSQANRGSMPQVVQDRRFPNLHLVLRLRCLYSQHQFLLEHLQQLQYTLFNRKLNLKLPIVVCGGGAVLLERFFKEVFEDVEVSPKALFVNADGGLELLE